MGVVLNSNFAVEFVQKGQYNIDGVSDYCLADETVNYCEVKKVLKAFLFDVG